MVAPVMPDLETERLVLRRLQPDDLGLLSRLHAERSFWEYPLRRGQTPAETEAFLGRVLDHHAQHGFGLAGVEDRRSGELAGWAGLSIPVFLPEILPAVEVGWRLGSAWRGRGYATEAGAAWVEWGFEGMGLDRILSIFEPANLASGRVMEKLGFELERTTVDPARGLELRVTVLTRDRWAGLRAVADRPVARPWTG